MLRTGVNKIILRVWIADDTLGVRSPCAQTHALRAHTRSGAENAESGEMHRCWWHLVLEAAKSSSLRFSLMVFLSLSKLFIHTRMLPINSRCRARQTLDLRVLCAVCAPWHVRVACGSRCWPHARICSRRASERAKVRNKRTFCRVGRARERCADHCRVRSTSSENLLVVSPVYYVSRPEFGVRCHTPFEFRHF